MSSTTIPPSQPARWDQAGWDHFRWDTIEVSWDKLFYRSSRSFTRRLANWNVLPDPITGWRRPEYDAQTIYGVLVERGGSLPAFASGVVMKMDAVLLTMDGVDPMDQIGDNPPLKIWQVDEIEEHTDTRLGGFAFRVCHLHRLMLHKEG